MQLGQVGNFRGQKGKPFQSFQQGIPNPRPFHLFWLPDTGIRLSQGTPVWHRPHPAYNPM